MSRGLPIPKKVRRQVRERSGGFCEARADDGSRLVDCEIRPASPEFHHLKSRARGGSNRAHNLRLVCWPCHRKITEHFPGTENLRTDSWVPEAVADELGEPAAVDGGAEEDFDAPFLRDE